MSATAEIVPLAKIKPQKDFDPRAEFDDAQMAGLVESVKQHGIISPLTLAPDGAGRLRDHRGRAPLPGGEGGEAPRHPAQVRDGGRREAHARGGRERDPRRPHTP
jgi:hypothetical protein